MVSLTGITQHEYIGIVQSVGGWMTVCEAIALIASSGYFKRHVQLPTVVPEGYNAVGLSPV